jgi:hypothetical protein
MSSASLLDGKAVMADRLASFAVPLEPHELPAAIDVIVRVVLSDIMAPSDSPEYGRQGHHLAREPGCWPPRR